jgi:glyoxylase-like metal-dependent hydrolase (beta-lactamase superfamily II)
MHVRRDSLTSRRRVLRGLATGVGCAALPQWARLGFAAEGIAATDLGDGLALLSGEAGNQLVLSSGTGQILVDSGSAAIHDAMLATLGELPGENVLAVFNTHWHPDQVGANATLGAAGATIYAHEKTRLRLASGYYRPNEDRYVAALPAEGLPTETIYEQSTVEIGGQPIEFGYLIEAHTDGDIYVAFPDQNVIAVGDVVAPDRDPVFDWFGGGWLGGRLDSLMLLLEKSNDETRFVPSYGPVISRAGVQAELDMSLELFERMVEHVRLGETPRDMLEAGVLDELGRDFADPYQLLYDLHKGFWAHHNKLMHDIV